MTTLTRLVFLLVLCPTAPAWPAPDEQALGSKAGYPIGGLGRSKNWFSDESVRVGSFTHQAEIPGLFRGKPNILQHAPAQGVLPLPKAGHEPDYRWQLGGRSLGVDDFLARQRIMGLLIVKDGVIQVERYQYERNASHRFTSQSMAKSITALAIGMALAEGRIESLDDRAERYAPKLRGSLFGETTLRNLLRNLLRMASGARYVQKYDGTGDEVRFNTALAREGIEQAAHVVFEREIGQGLRFNYSSAQTTMLGAVLRGATGQSLSDYLTPRLWQAIGAEHSALWSADQTGLEVASGVFNATLRDYARLGVVLANDGVRPDDPAGKPIITREFLLQATDWKLGPPAFRPGTATPTYGYGYQFWLYPGEQRRFMLLGVFGQSMFIDPATRLVIVQTAANATAEAGGTSLARERDAFWRGVLQHHYKP